MKFHSEHFNTVENNSSFYRISKESTYKTWSRMTPDNYKFSLKLNKAITHTYKLELDDEVRKKVHFIINSTQILKSKLGAIVIQLPPSFKYDIEKLDLFLSFLRSEIESQEYKLDIVIEFRNKYWFNNDVYKLLKTYNVGIVVAQSSRYPGVKEVTADFAYIRLYGPTKLFDSSYSTEELTEWKEYINSIINSVKRIYVYFNNDFHGFAIQNAKELSLLLQ